MAAQKGLISLLQGQPATDLLVHQGSPDTAEIIIKKLPQKQKTACMSRKKWNLYNVEIQNDHCGCCLPPDKRIIFIINDFQNDK